MTKKFVSVRFTKTATTDVIGQVDTDLSGADLEDRVAIPVEWLKEFFGSEWNEWHVEDVQELTEDPATRAILDREMNMAPLFEITEEKVHDDHGSE